MISPIGKVTPMGLSPRDNNFVVAGIFKSGFYQYDAGVSFISLEDAQDFFGLGNYVSGLHVRVSDIFLSEKISKGIQNRIGDSYQVRSWQTMNQNLFSALKTEKTTMTILLMFRNKFNILVNLHLCNKRCSASGGSKSCYSIILRIYFF